MFNDLFLITSGAYCNDELTSDFGLLPSSFLPVGHKRLFELQIELLKQFKGRVFISLPDTYNLISRDRSIIVKNNVKIHWTNSNLSLSQSILSFINTLDLNGHSRLFILHGDTLFNKLNFTSDILYYGSTDMFYKWGRFNDYNKIDFNLDTEKNVIAGYFSFSDIALLKNELGKSNSFELGLWGYNNKLPFKMLKGEGWLDFGHSNQYYRSKRSLNVTRNFNKAIVENNNIRKESRSIEKIKREYQWFKNVPSVINPYLPQVWGFEKDEVSASYAIEFIGAPTLQEKFVFGDLPDYIFVKIIDRLFDFIKISKSIIYNCESYKNSSNKSFNKLYIDKTKIRLKEYLKLSGFDSGKNIKINGKEYPNLNNFANSVLDEIKDFMTTTFKEDELSLMHGDLCFSNILFDTRSNNIKIIDPRGSLNKKLNDNNIIFGDYKYDVSKLGHSLIGNYDYIVTGFYKLNYDIDQLNFEFDIISKKTEKLENYFYDKCLDLNIPKQFIKASITNLFLSMLPLHNEDSDRQIALLLNAYKFYYN